MDFKTKALKFNTLYHSIKSPYFLRIQQFQSPPCFLYEAVDLATTVG